MTDEDIRIVDCERCQGSGEIEHGHPNAPHAEWTERCPSCDGVGEYTVECQPITIDDLEEMYRD